jgi:hypothetical protein
MIGLEAVQQFYRMGICLPSVTLPLAIHHHDRHHRHESIRPVMVVMVVTITFYC